jgi:C4-type Zn-finger protein
VNACPICRAPTSVWKREDYHHDGVTLTYVERCTRCSYESPKDVKIKDALGGSSPGETR